MSGQDPGPHPRRPRRPASPRRPVDLGPGSVIGGFEIEALIGRGGMSSVFRARQTHLQRSVALKVLLPVLSADEQFVQRFHLEGVNAARLDHPNIVPVYEAGQDKGHVYIAMRLVEGVTLRDRLGDAAAALTNNKSLEILSAIGDALDYAHGLSYVHRDVKPGNVLLAFNGRTYLSDFGLTKLLGRDPMITSTGQWVGTADYMAPEQARGGEVDHRADLYAFGCVAFECITGSKPYAGDDAITLVFAHATRDIPSASAINPALGSRVDEVIRRALAKAPEDRYERATDLLAELREALEQAPVGGEPSAVPGRRPGSPRTRAAHGCPACRATASAGDASCGACGAALAWCASCAHPMLRSDRFCQHCGRPPR